jgi:hypothetical protein
VREKKKKKSGKTVANKICETVKTWGNSPQLAAAAGFPE